MKIKNYKSFLESDEFKSPDIEAANNQLSSLKNQLNDFKSKKSNIDNIYSRSKTDDELKKNISPVMDEKNPNPFITEYLHICELKRKIENSQKSISEDKIKKDDFNEQLRLSTDIDNRQNINNKIKEIDNRISLNTNSINTLNKEINDSQSNLNKKMTDLEKNMMDNIKKISNQS